MIATTPPAIVLKEMFPDILKLDNGKIEGMLKDMRERDICPCCQVRRQDPGRAVFTRSEDNRLIAACEQMQEYLKKTERLAAAGIDIRPLLEKQHNINTMARTKAQRVLAAITGKAEDQLPNEDVKKQAAVWREVMTA